MDPSSSQNDLYEVRDPEPIAEEDVLLPVGTRFVTIRKTDRPPPVPEFPVPLCPNCGYNLTGLLSRICPECGQQFDLRHVRRIALGLDQEESTGNRELDLARDRRAVRRQRIRLLAGLALIAAGFALTFALVMIHAGGGTFLYVQFRVALIALLLFKFLMEEEWADAVWKTGWIMLLLGVFKLLP